MTPSASRAALVRAPSSDKVGSEPKVAERPPAAVVAAAEDAEKEALRRRCTALEEKVLHLEEGLGAALARLAALEAAAQLAAQRHAAEVEASAPADLPEVSTLPLSDTSVSMSRQAAPVFVAPPSHAAFVPPGAPQELTLPLSRLEPPEDSGGLADTMIEGAPRSEEPDDES